MKPSSVPRFLVFATLSLLLQAKTVYACREIQIPPISSVHTVADWQRVEHLQVLAANESLRCSVPLRGTQRYLYMKDASWSFFNAALVAHRLGDQREAQHYTVLASAIFDALDDKRAMLPQSIRTDLEALRPLLKAAHYGRWPVL